MEENLDVILKKLSLTESENEDIKIQEESFKNSQGKTKFCLLAKLLTQRPFNKGTLKSTMINLWKPMTTRGVKARDIGDNLFLFEFHDQYDKETVLIASPWCFDRQLLVLKDFNGDSQLANISLDEALFWVQIYDLPIMAMTREVGKAIGETMGTVEEVEAEADGTAWGRFLRVRVRLDVRKPLTRVKRVKLGSDPSILVYFRYERLPNFCFYCGKLDHGERECKMRLRNKGKMAAESSENQYGVWLRAPVGRDKAQRLQWGRNEVLAAAEGVAAVRENDDAVKCGTDQVIPDLVGLRIGDEAKLEEQNQGSSSDVNIVDADMAKSIDGQEESVTATSSSNGGSAVDMSKPQVQQSNNGVERDLGTQFMTQTHNFSMQKRWKRRATEPSIWS